MKKIHIIGGGTVAHIRPHLALCAPAYGKTVRDLFSAIRESTHAGEYLVHLYTTKMAGNRHQIWTANTGIDDDAPLNLETNADIAEVVDSICRDPEPSIVFMPAALCDFEPHHLETTWMDSKRGVMHKDLAVGKDLERLRTTQYQPLTSSDDWGAQTNDPTLRVALLPAAKVIQKVRATRKDIFLVGFKTTTGAEKQNQFNTGLSLMKATSCNLVLANDLVTRLNMVITPEQAPYYVSTDRRHVLRQLVGMTLKRSRGHFTRSVVDKDLPLVAWNAEFIPASLRTVVSYCIARGAYKPFMGKTVGHFAMRMPIAPESGLPPTFITSRRGVDFNKLDEVGMVLVQTDGDDKVIAGGAKPSVGGQSQRIIFAAHPELDCIVHFHCPLREEPLKTFVQTRFDIEAEHVPVRSQGPYECGSHECGQNTSDGLKSIRVDSTGTPWMKAVMLDKHGPNIVFNSKIDPTRVIDFIERHWDLERSTSEVE